MFSKIHTISSILSYDAADNYFKRYTRPLSRSWGRPVWSADARPLGGTNQWHYRLEQGPDERYYDACLYHTAMVRWHRPEQDGTRRVQVHHDERNTSTQFLWRMGWGRDNTFNFIDGGKACVPMIGNQLREGEYWALDLCYAQDGRVIKERSWHAPLRKAVTKPETLRYRRELLAFFDPYLCLLAQNASLRDSQTPPGILGRGWVDAAFAQGEGERLGAIVAVLKTQADWKQAGCEAGSVSESSRFDVIRWYLREAVLCASSRYLRDAWEPLPDWQENYPKNNISVA